MAVVRVAAGHDHAVGPAAERLHEEHEIYPAGARETDDPDVGGVFNTARAREVGAGIGAPVADECYDLGFKFGHILLLTAPSAPHISAHSYIPVNRSPLPCTGPRKYRIP